MEVKRLTNEERRANYARQHNGSFILTPRQRRRIRKRENRLRGWK